MPSEPQQRQPGGQLGPSQPGSKVSESTTVKIHPQVNLHPQAPREPQHRWGERRAERWQLKRCRLGSKKLNGHRLPLMPLPHSVNST